MWLPESPTFSRVFGVLPYNLQYLNNLLTEYSAKEVFIFKALTKSPT
jgi:hypothetical protein